MIELSLIVPVYNALPYLGECVESLFRQGLAEEQMEVLLIDDGSTDGSWALMQRLGEAHPAVRTLQQENQGVAATRNRGIREARGEYLAFVDADDALRPHSLPFLLAQARATGADMTRFDLRRVSDRDLTKELVQPEAEAPEEKTETMGGEEAYRQRYDANEGYCFRYLYATDFLRREELRFPEGVKMMEDAELVERAMIRARKVTLTRVCAYLYRWSRTSCLSTMNASKLCDVGRVVASLNALLHDGSLPPATRRCMARNIYGHLSVALWYLTHYRSCYAQRGLVIPALQRSMKRVPAELPLKERIGMWAALRCPGPYLTLRYLLARKKYDQ